MKISPLIPAKYEIADVAAIQALARGDADEHMQRRALKWIIESCAKVYDEQYYPDSTRDTDFALGKRNVGNQIIKLTKLNLGSLKEKEEAKLPAMKPQKEFPNDR